MPSADLTKARSVLVSSARNFRSTSLRLSIGYQKTGYILSAFAGSLGLSNSFFAMCKSHLPKGKSYLSSESQGFIWHEEWKLYAPKNLMHMIDKGVTDYDAI